MRNIDIDRAGYLRHSFIAGFPTERVPKMPLSGVSTRSGDLAWFTFKALDGTMTDVFIHLISTPQRSRGVRELDLYHQVQLRRQHLPAAQDAHRGGAQQRVRVAALVHRAGRPRVVHLVEALHGLVLVVLAALQQVMHGHGAAVVVDVVAALAVGKDLG